MLALLCLQVHAHTCRLASKYVLELHFSLHLFDCVLWLCTSVHHKNVYAIGVGPWYQKAEEVSSSISFPFLTKEKVALNGVTLSPSCRADYD